MIATTLNLLVYALPLSSTVPQTSSPTKGKGKGKGKKATSGTQQASSTLKLLHTVEIPASIGEGTFRAARSVNLLAQIVVIHIIRQIPPFRRENHVHCYQHFPFADSEDESTFASGLCLSVELRVMDG